jgi:16S rRNA (guanine527-N7)-methyltransferase
MAKTVDTWDPFATLTETQREQLDAYAARLRRFNQKINLISPETEDAIRERHLMHCLTLARCSFPAGSRIVDWGTGGGLPAIPLAIGFPDVEVVGVDSVGKKVRAVRAIARRLGLDNCTAWKGRAAEWDGTAHYSVSRATEDLDVLWHWHRRVATPLDAAPLDDASTDDAWAPGLLTLKGGDLSAEIDGLRAEDPDATIERHDLHTWLGRDYFRHKELVHVTPSSAAAP